MYSQLKSFVCDERIDRFSGTADRSESHFLDAITASLSFENGTEEYSAIRQNTSPLHTISDLTGAWSQGEYGSLLHQTAQLLQIQPVYFERSAYVETETASIYGFDVAAENSPWSLVVDSHEYRLAFHTDVWISSQSGNVLRVRRSAIQIPAKLRISAIDWTVSLRPVSLNNAEWLLPATAEYSVLYGDKGRREWNQISFSNYRRYGSETELRFGGE